MAHVIAVLIQTEPTEDMLDAIATTLGLFGISRAEMVTGREDDGRLWDDGQKPSDKQLWFARKMLKEAQNRASTPEMRENVAVMARALADPKITRQWTSEIIDGLQQID